MVLYKLKLSLVEFYAITRSLKLVDQMAQVTTIPDYLSINGKIVVQFYWMKTKAVYASIVGRWRRANPS
jgi:hypothetical protein